jgi:hypothetical protein
MRTWIVCLLALAALPFAAAPAHAQNAAVVGVVKDTSGGVMPGATVTARNSETGLTRSVVSDEAGAFRLPALPPGLYAVTAALDGFGTETIERLQLSIDQTASLDFQLKPANLAESVIVTSDAPLVDTRVSAVSTSVSNQQIQDLPVASRRWIDLAMLTPGTSQDNIRGNFYRGNVNIGGGGREYSNGFVVDGVNNTWAQMGEPRQNFAMDSIREFKVSTSTVKAEYGLATGGMLTVVSRSGTNDFHGSGLLFFRDKAITQKTQFETTKPDFRRYQYGATLGGPIIQNKTHFFAAYEGTNEDQFYTVATGGLWPAEDGTYKSAQTRWTYMGKVDHQLSPSQTLFFRWAAESEYRPIITVGGPTTPSASYDFAVPRSSAVLGHTWVLSTRALNDFRFQYAFAKYEVAPPYSHGSWDSGDFGADRLSYCTPVFVYPSVRLGGCGNSQMGPETRWELKDDFSYLMNKWGGTHQWKTGFDVSFTKFQSDSLGSPLGTWTFPKDTPYNANDRTTWPTQYTDSLPTYADIPVTHLSTYVQDDWQIGSRLTVNLGLRYDLQLGAFNEDVPELLGRIADKLGSQFSTFPVPVPFLDGSDHRGDRNNFGPRAGFALDAFGDGKTNIHGGYGLFYENMRTLQNFGELTWPQAQTIIISNPGYPDPFGGRSRDQFLSTAAPNITVFDNKTVSAYAHQVSGGVTTMLTKNLALSTDVTASFRYSDRTTVDINLPDQVTKIRPYPQFGRVSYGQPTADDTYRALLVKVDKRMANRYQMLASYTLSKADATVYTNGYQAIYGYTLDKTPAVADRRQRLVLSGIVQLPFGAQASAIADFRSSLPFQPTTSLDLNGDGYTGDLPPGVARVSGCRGLDLGAVNTFRTGRNLAAVNDVSCPGYANVDVRLSKFFTVADGHRLEVIAQLFNVANRANLNTATNNLTSGVFGQSTSIVPYINAPSRQFEFAVRYQF